MLTFAATVPHSPILIPSIGQNQTKQAQKTILAYKNLAMELKKIAPQTLVIVSPHGPMRYDKFTLNLEENFRGNFSNFGINDDIDFNFLNNITLTRLIQTQLRQVNFPVDVLRESNLDYGTMVPLFYLTENLEKKPRIIPLTFTSFDWEMHYQFGCALGQILHAYDENVAFISSADLSQRLDDQAPAGYSPYGAKFDQTLTELLIHNKHERILKLNPDFCNEAGECGLRSILMAMGVTANYNPRFHQLSYESPFGIGFFVGQWKINPM